MSLKHKDINLQIIFSITIMAVLGLTSISPAFPKIVDELKVPAKDIGLLLTVFTLPGIFLTPIFGIVADRYGRKMVLVPSLLFYSIAGTICFFVRDFNLLLILRFIEGIGAASLGSLNVTLIGDLYTGKRRTEIMGYNMSVLSIGTALFPIIGGALAVFGWYYPFALPIIGFPVGLAVLFKLQDRKVENHSSLKEYLFGAWESIKNKEVFGLLLSSIFTYIIVFGVFLTYLPFLIKNLAGNNPFIIGIMLSVMSFTAAFVAFWLGKITGKYSERKIIKSVFIIYSIAQIIMILSPNLYILFLPTVLFGIAQGLNIPSVQTLLAGITSDEHRAAFMSLNRMIAQVGQTIGPLIMGLIYFNFGLSAVFIFGACLTLLIFGFLFRMIK